MKQNEFSKFLGKQVFISLKSGLIYNGIVKETTENFIFISDKFNKPVTIAVSEISSLEEKA